MGAVPLSVIDTSPPSERSKLCWRPQSTHGGEKPTAQERSPATWHSLPAGSDVEVTVEEGEATLTWIITLPTGGAGVDLLWLKQGSDEQLDCVDMLPPPSPPHPKIPQPPIFASPPLFARAQVNTYSPNNHPPPSISSPPSPPPIWSSAWLWLILAPLLLLAVVLIQRRTCRQGIHHRTHPAATTRLKAHMQFLAWCAQLPRCLSYARSIDETAEEAAESQPASSERATATRLPVRIELRSPFQQTFKALHGEADAQPNS